MQIPVRAWHCQAPSRFDLSQALFQSVLDLRLPREAEDLGVSTSLPSSSLVMAYQKLQLPVLIAALDRSSQWDLLNSLREAGASLLHCQAGA